MEYLQYRMTMIKIFLDTARVLNLIINGIPSILLIEGGSDISDGSFKPYYKWNTFNTV